MAGPFAAHQNFLVVGPWNHGGWSAGEGRTLGPIDFGSATAAHYRQNVLAPFFAYYLKGKGAPPEVARRMEVEGERFTPNTPEEFSLFVRAESQKWAKVVRDAGIKAE